MLFAHVSDTHITTDPLGVDAAQRARDAMMRVQAMSPRPAFVVISGDLVDQGSAEEYALATAMLDLVDLPVHVVPGNHDHAATLLQHLTGAGYAKPAPQETDRCYYRIDYPELTMLCCDSSVVGRDDGELGPTQLRWLDRQLSASGRSVVVAMHHHPVPSGIAAMDAIMLRDAASLAQVLNRHHPVQRLLVGHLHRATTTTFAGTVVTSAPSTYRQVQLNLMPGGVAAFVEEPPGLLLHQLGPSQAVTHFVHVRASGPSVGPVRNVTR